MDSGDNGEVRYELKKGHGELFRVSRKTGEISLKQNLEGHNREYQLMIAAYDGGKFGNFVPLLQRLIQVTNGYFKSISRHTMTSLFTTPSPPSDVMCGNLDATNK